MKDEKKLLRARERRFVRRTIIASVCFFLLLAAGGVYVYAAYPQWVEKDIRADIQAGRYEIGLEKTDEIRERAPETAQELDDACHYGMAENLLTAREYDRARSAFLALGDYSDAGKRAKECLYDKAVSMMAAGDYGDAEQIFLSISDYGDSMQLHDECRYQRALILESEGKQVDALQMYLGLKGYADSDAHARALACAITGLSDEDEAMAQIQNLSATDMEGQAELTQTRASLRSGTLCVGGAHTVGLKSDGTVVAAGANDCGQCGVSGWTNIVMVDAGALHTAGLKSDGTVVATGSNEHGQCDVGEWQNVKQIACGDYATFALMEDGTVAAAGFLTYKLDGWRGMTYLAAGSYEVCALDGGGFAYVSHESARCDDFSSLISIDCTTGGAVGLRRDGTVAASFPGMPEWTGIAEISVGSSMVLGIQAGGNVIAHRYFDTAAPNVESVKNAVTVAAGGAHCAVLTEDGRVYAFGKNESGQCNTEDWNLK